MALFVDSIPSEPSDLLSYESSLFDTAATERIDLMTKGTVAATEIELELRRFLLRVPGGNNIGIEQVVTTEALRRWHILRTIALTYLDCYHQQLNERYKHKLEQYLLLSDSAAILLFDIGVGVVYSPIRRPTTPSLSNTAGNQMAGTWFAKVSWVTNDGTESEVGPMSSLTTPPGCSVTVTPPPAPVNVKSWNVYLGTHQEILLKQNTTPIPLEAVWTLPQTGITSGNVPPKGQPPDTYLRRSNAVLRG
jgi:hypothetical protein